LPIEGTSTSDCTGDRITIQGGAQVSVNASMFSRLQDDYIASIAQVAGVPTNRVRILTVTEITTQRRLLATSVVFTFEIVVARTAGAQVEHLLQDQLVQLMAKKGLPQAVVMSILRSCGIGK